MMQAGAACQARGKTDTVPNWKLQNTLAQLPGFVFLYTFFEDEYDLFGRRGAV